MNLQDMIDVAQAIVAPGKGILAADESDSTIQRRFDSIGVESTFENRRDYREGLFRTEGAAEFVSGVILYDETLRQDGADGNPSRRRAFEPGDHSRHQGGQEHQTDWL